MSAVDMTVKASENGVQLLVKAAYIQIALMLSERHENISSCIPICKYFDLKKVLFLA